MYLQSFDPKLHAKILEVLNQRYPDFTTEEDYAKMLALFSHEHEFHTALLHMEQHGMITSGLIKSFTGYVCDIGGLAVVKRS